MGTTIRAPRTVTNNGNRGALDCSLIRKRRALDERLAVLHADLKGEGHRVCAGVAHAGVALERARGSVAVQLNLPRRSVGVISGTGRRRSSVRRWAKALVNADPGTA